MIREMVAGANAALTAENPGLAQVLVGIGWTVTSSRGPQAELVPMAIMCGPNGKALTSAHVVFFNQLESPEGTVAFAADDADDQEQIDVQLDRIPADVTKIVFFVYVDPDIRGSGTFGAVRAAHIRVATRENRDLVKFSVPLENVRSVGAVMFGELYRHGSDWKFRALGQGYAGGLASVFADFGIAP